MSARNGWLAAFERLSVKPVGSVKVPVMSKKDDGKPLPSLRGPRSPKGKNGGMTEEQDRVRRLERQKAKRQAMPSEHQEQATVIAWWAIYAAAHKLDERLLMSLPNGAHLAGDGRQRAIQMHKLKATGLRVGAPDLLLAIAAGMAHGLFIELKRLDGKLSAEQHSFGMLLQSQGYAWVMAKGAGEAIRAIEAYLGVSKAETENH